MKVIARTQMKLAIEHVAGVRHLTVQRRSAFSGVAMASAFRKAFPWGVGRDCNQGVQDTKTDLGV
jgi:hypothetical protein